jgi:nitronate monooxygenase
MHQGAQHPVPRYSAATPTTDTDGDIGAMALYAGLGVGAIRDVLPAAQIVSELVSALA